MYHFWSNTGNFCIFYFSFLFVTLISVIHDGFIHHGWQTLKNQKHNREMAYTKINSIAPKVMHILKHSNKQLMRWQYSGSYLRQITSGRWVGTQKQKHPNRYMQKLFKIMK